MMKRSIQFFKQKAYDFRWALLSGVLVGTSYIPFPPWALFFCYVPVWLMVMDENISLKRIFVAGWMTQFVLSLIGFHWIAYTAHEFGQIPWPIAYLALILFCALMHLYIPAAMVAATWLKNRFALKAGATLVSLALIHSLLERVWPVIFDWNLGYSLLWSENPIYHLADLIGFQGLSAFILLLNAWMALAWLNRKSANIALLHLTSAVLLFGSLVGFGYLHGQKWNETDRELKATIIQANIGNLEKIYAEQGRAYQEVITQKFIDMTLEADQKFPDTDIYLWPETAFPDYLDTHYNDRKHPQQLSKGLANLNKPLIVGAYSKDPQTDVKEDRSTYNALFLIDSEAANLDKPYRKTELLAFGEYLPLSEKFPFLLKLLPFVSNFGRGHGPDVLKWLRNNEEVRWGGQICYEGLDPAFTRGLSEKEATLLVNVTNDSWFGMTSEPHQHLYMTLARAIEIRRPLLRSTNTGISTAILANGTVLQKSPMHEPWSGQFVIKYLQNPPQTFFVQWGHFDWALLCLILFFVILRGALHARPRRS